jgi:hypothetical protein
VYWCWQLIAIYGTDARYYSHHPHHTQCVRILAITWMVCFQGILLLYQRGYATTVHCRCVRAAFLRMTVNNVEYFLQLHIVGNRALAEPLISSE